MAGYKDGVASATADAPTIAVPTTASPSIARPTAAVSTVGLSTTFKIPQSAQLAQSGGALPPEASACTYSVVIAQARELQGLVLCHLVVKASTTYVPGPLRAQSGPFR